MYDSFCGIVNAYPASSKGSDFVYSCLRHFVGLRFKNPDTVCRSDAAPELVKAIRDLGWLPETALPRRWPITCRYAAVAVSIDTWEKAFGTEFKGANYALGQLSFY